MTDINIMRPMQQHGKAKFIKRFEDREDRAQMLASLKENQCPDTAEISGGKTQETGPENRTKEWTILCYIDGHNDLEPYATYSMLDLEAVGSNKNVNVVAELGRISQEQLKKISEAAGRPYEPTNVDGDWSGIRRYLVEKDDPSNPAAVRQINSKVAEDLGEVDMSNPRTLSDFLIWGIKNYPAKNYLVVLMDHGGGWRGAFTDDASASGTHIMTPPQINEAFKMSEKETGVKPDVIDMVACLMGSSEVGYEMKDAAKFYCGSEEIATTDAFIYSPILEHIQKSVASGEQLAPRDLARYLVDYYADKYTAYATKSAMDLSKMEALKNSVNNLAVALSSTSTKPEALKSAINGAQNFSRNYYLEFYSHFRDLYSVAEQLVNSPDITDTRLKDAAKAVMTAVKDTVVARINSPYEREELLDNSRSLDGREHISIIKRSQAVMDTEGMSIYAPTDRKYTDNPGNMDTYGKLQLSKDTQWDEFLVRQNQQQS